MAIRMVGLRLAAPIMISFVAAPATAEDTQPLGKLFQCRTIIQDAARLACADREISALEAAAGRRDVVVVDRLAVGKVRRSLFGLALPNLTIFSKGESKAEQEEFSQIESTLAQVGGGGGAWSFVLADGARWIQNDGMEMARDPKPGDTIRIRKAPIGGYLANVSGQRAIRVRRVN